MPGNYRSMHYWSPITGDYAVTSVHVGSDRRRIFSIVPRVDGKAWKDIRVAALTAIQEAIDSGAEPGPVSNVGLHVETEVYPNE
jgi:hypothetical protein